MKALNTLGGDVVADPVVAGRLANLFLAGDDACASEAVADLPGELGFAPVAIGGLTLAGELESLARLWIALAERGCYGRARPSRGSPSGADRLRRRPRRYHAGIARDGGAESRCRPSLEVT